MLSIITHSKHLFSAFLKQEIDEGEGGGTWTDMRDNQTENPTTNTENKEYKNEVREAITGAKQDTFDLYADIQKFNRTLKKGVEGEDVRALQKFLGVNQTGFFGDKTEIALKKFQKTLGYEWPDGILTIRKGRTYKTLAAIQEALAPVQIDDKQEKINIQVPDTQDFEAFINTANFNRTLRLGMEGSDVMALQEFLRLNMDKDLDPLERLVPSGKFDIATEDKLKEYQKKLGYAHPDGVLIVNDSHSATTLSSIQTGLDYAGNATNIYKRKANYQDVKQTINVAKQKIDAFIRFIEHADDFYTALEAYVDGGFRDDVISDMGSVFGWFKEAFGKNKADAYFKKMNSYKDLIDKNEDKFNAELLKLLPKKEVSKYISKDGKPVEINRRNKSLGLYGVRDSIIVFAPLMAGGGIDAPLLDVRMNFAKNIVSLGIPMDKALAFKNWVDGGMVGEPNYSPENLEEISGKEALYSLSQVRAILSAYGFSQKDINKSLLGDLESLSDKQKEFFQVVFEKNIIPDLITLHQGGFNWLERYFDDNDNKIANFLQKIQGKKYAPIITGDIADISRGKEKGISSRSSLKKIGQHYILELDYLFGNEYKIFENKPSSEEIEITLLTYLSENTKDRKKSAWGSYERVKVGKITSGKLFPMGEKYMLIYDGKYRVFGAKPEKKDIAEAYKNFASWEEVEGKNRIDASPEELFRDVSEIIALLKKQAKKGRWFGDNGGELTKGIKGVEERIEHAEGFIPNYTFLKNAIAMLSEQEQGLFARFSMISIFENIDYFFIEFPASASVVSQFQRLDKQKNSGEYISALKEVLRNPDVIEYLKIIQEASVGNKGMEAWKEYRRGNIEKYRGLTKVNQSPERQFKYGEELTLEMSAEDVIQKLKNETTQADPEAHNILGNLESGLLDIGITDVTSQDLENAIRTHWKAIPMKEFNGAMINTSHAPGYDHDAVRDFKWLVNRGDTHIFQTVVEKKFVLYKKNGEKVEVSKKYYLYIRPECTNILVMPYSKQIQEKEFDKKIWNMYRPSLNTKTLPVTLNMIGFAAKKISDIFNNNSPSAAPNTPGGGNVPGIGGGTTNPGSGGSGGTVGGGTTI